MRQRHALTSPPRPIRRRRRLESVADAVAVVRAAVLEQRAPLRSSLRCSAKVWRLWRVLTTLSPPFPAGREGAERSRSILGSRVKNPTLPSR